MLSKVQPEILMKKLKNGRKIDEINRMIFLEVMFIPFVHFVSGHLMTISAVLWQLFFYYSMTHLKVRNDALSQNFHQQDLDNKYYKIVTMAVFMGNLMIFWKIF